MKVSATPTNALLCLSNFPIWQRGHKRLSQNYQKDGTDSQDRTGKEFPPADFKSAVFTYFTISALILLKIKSFLTSDGEASWNNSIIL